MATIRIKRGLKASLPSSGMVAGEPLVTTDRGTLHVATAADEKLPVVPALEDLQALASIEGESDLIMLHDASEEAGQKEKKITFADFKNALNIPEASTDEMVALAPGGTSGYLFGSDGTNGVVAMGEGLSWALNAEGTQAVLSIGTIDGGTF
ncbi:hypothetical protein [Chlorobium sp. N1]|uniref:hypothetical protein n=1 Tax=Chlorobium sp. N1 TaxID=2491138 RepID=UPI00103D07E3|nr:hypothetical protein [Chlorobium sp. N1]TCD47018.1 hypothetical protein E0L29_10310 [Chlorobium sp. N1]